MPESEESFQYVGIGRSSGTSEVMAKASDAEEFETNEETPSPPPQQQQQPDENESIKVTQPAGIWKPPIVYGPKNVLGFPLRGGGVHRWVREVKKNLCPEDTWVHHPLETVDDPLAFSTLPPQTTPILQRKGPPFHYRLHKAIASGDRKVSTYPSTMYSSYFLLQCDVEHAGGGSLSCSFKTLGGGLGHPIPVILKILIFLQQNFCRIVDPGGRTSRKKGGGWSCRKWVERPIPRNLINHTEEEWEVGFRVFSFFLCLPISSSRPTQLLQQLEINKAKQKNLWSSISTTMVVGGGDWGMLRVGMTGVLREASC
jgi:hypothetical protein